MEGELDVSSSPRVKDELTEQLIQKGEKQVALDCASLDYIDSSGLATIVSLHKKLKMNGGTLALFSLNDTLSRLFRLTSLDKALTIVPNQKALADLD